MIDFEAVRRANPLPEVAAKIVALRPSRQEWRACCPFHPDRTPSFTIFDGGRRFHCFGCGAAGDVLDFVQRAYRVTLAEAARMLGTGSIPKHVTETTSPNDNNKLTAKALAIWKRTISAAGTPAEAYLRGRGIDPPYPFDLRFLELPCEDRGMLPCLVAAVRGIAGNVTGIQRIWLATEGRGKADVPKPKRSLGTIKGGAIRLGELDGSGELIVCEGPEDGLSLQVMTGKPVWVAAGASFLPAMRLPPNVRSVVIGADNDAAGEQAARTAAHAFACQGRLARILRPLEDFKDFNDELRGPGDDQA